MKSGKLTNTLLALIFLALLAHLVVPVLRTSDAAAQGRDAISPSAAAAAAGVPPVYEQLASQATKGLQEIARANQQIANAIREHARSNERIAESLENMAREMKSIQPRTAASPSRRAPEQDRSEPEETDPNWWKEYIQE